MLKGAQSKGQQTPFWGAATCVQKMYSNVQGDIHWNNEKLRNIYQQESRQENHDKFHQTCASMKNNELVMYIIIYV
jgi:hypothetical protein